MAKERMSLKEAVENSKQYRIRMFKSDFLENNSHVHPIVPLLVYAPVVLVAIFFSFYTYNISILPFFAYFAAGLVSWMFVEYFLHRFVFHPPMTNAFFRGLYFYSHGVHHDAMKDATRLVMPPGASLPLTILIYFGIKAALPVYHLPMFSGFLVAYLIYDYLHFATHFYALPYKWFKVLKKNHMRHHNLDPNKNFGFTSPLFDILFRTYIKVEKK